MHGRRGLFAMRLNWAPGVLWSVALGAAAPVGRHNIARNQWEEDLRLFSVLLI